MKEIIIEKIIKIINSNIEGMGITEDDLDEDLIELGIDSITFIQIIVSLEEEFECEIPDSKLFIRDMNTVNKIVSIFKSI